MKPFLTFCAICCFVGIFRLPIEYYTFLRILISIGALIVLYHVPISKQYYFTIIFLVILIIFNPVFPIYLYQKNLWIPIDVITGILFLLINFIDKPEQKKDDEITEETSEFPSRTRSPMRDRIINPKKTKDDQ